MRFAILFFAAAVLGGTAASWPASRATACTGDGAAALREVPLIVAASVVSREPLPPLAGTDHGETLLTVHVERYLKGTGASSLQVRTSGILTSCATGSTKPYLVSGLMPQPDGVFTMHALITVWGIGPADPEIQNAISSFERGLQAATPRPPVVGNANLLQAKADTTAVLALCVALVLVARSVTRRSTAASEDQAHEMA